MKRFLLTCLVLAAAWMAPGRADALLCHAILGCSCNVTATPLDFESFSPLDGVREAEGEVSVDCTGIAELFPSLGVRMQSGQYGTISARKMRSTAGDLLDYNIYTTNQYSAIWGNGTTGTIVNISGGVLGLGHWTASRAVHGRLTPTATTKPGAYRDTVVVRIDW